MNKVSKILLFLLISATGVCIYQYNNPRIENKFIQVGGKIPPPEIVYSKSSTGTNVATIKTPEPVLKPEKEASEQLLNTVKTIKEINSKSTVTDLTRIVSNLELKLTEKDMIINDKSKQIKVWKDKHNEITVNNDLNEASVKAEVSPVIVGYEKREKWYKSKEGFTSITSENPSIVFNGVEKYTTKNKEVKNILELTFDGEVGKFGNDKDKLYYEGLIDVTFNPDGTLRPFIKAGYKSNNFETPSPYYSIGFKYLIFKL